MCKNAKHQNICEVHGGQVFSFYPVYVQVGSLIYSAVCIEGQCPGLQVSDQSGPAQDFTVSDMVTYKRSHPPTAV